MLCSYDITLYSLMYGRSEVWERKITNINMQISVLTLHNIESFTDAKKLSFETGILAPPEGGTSTLQKMKTQRIPHNTVLSCFLTSSQQGVNDSLVDIGFSSRAASLFDEIIKRQNKFTFTVCMWTTVAREDISFVHALLAHT